MNPILRVLRMATESPDRRHWIVIFLAILDFCCVLLAAERYDKGDIRVGTYWLLAGIALSLLGWKWPQIRTAIGLANRQYTRMILTLVFFGLSLYLFHALATRDFIMQMHQRLRGWPGFAVASLVGATVSCGYWWLTGRMFVPSTASESPPKLERFETALQARFSMNPTGLPLA